MIVNKITRQKSETKNRMKILNQKEEHFETKNKTNKRNQR